MSSAKMLKRQIYEMDQLPKNAEKVPQNTQMLSNLVEGRLKGLIADWENQTSNRESTYNMRKSEATVVKEVDPAIKVSEEENEILEIAEILQLKLEEKERKE